MRWRNLRNKIVSINQVVSSRRRNVKEMRLEWSSITTQMRWKCRQEEQLDEHKEWLTELFFVSGEDCPFIPLWLYSWSLSVIPFVPSQLPPLTSRIQVCEGCRIWKRSWFVEEVNISVFGRMTINNYLLSPLRLQPM